jgi:hypothetical protein
MSSSRPPSCLCVLLLVQQCYGILLNRRELISVSSLPFASTLPRKPLSSTAAEVLLGGAAAGATSELALDTAAPKLYRYDYDFRKEANSNAAVAEASELYEQFCSVQVPSMNLPPLVDDGTTRLVLVRHGRTPANALGICRGARIDDPLDVVGSVQAVRTGDALADGERRVCILPIPKLRMNE